MYRPILLFNSLPFHTAIPIVFILFQNLASFLPASTGGLSNNTRGVSVVISSQVGERGNSRPSQTLKNSPLSLNFSFRNNVSPVLISHLQHYAYCVLLFTSMGIGGKHSTIPLCVLELFSTVSITDL